jgi:hypothetical protein
MYGWNLTRHMPSLLAAATLLLCGTLSRAADDDLIEQALREVRGVKRDLFSRHSSVLGELPDAEEQAARQLMARPIPPIQTDRDATVTVDAERAAELSRELNKRIAGLAKRSSDRKGGIMTRPLGVTGAHMAMDYHGRQDLLILRVEEDSPAAGRLEERDVVVGANGRLIADPEDARPELGYALAESQSPQLGGILTLHIVREGQALDVKLDLGNRIYYGNSWPYGCEKTRQIREAALRAVMENGPEPKHLHGRHQGGGFWTPLFLMASGDEAAMERVGQWIKATTKPDAEYPDVVPGGRSWMAAYELINVAEYHLLTGDRGVLRRIQYLVRHLEKIQFPSGGWSHGTPPGYGEINNVGLAAFIGLILARECGAEMDARKFAKSIRYFGKFCGTNLGYGLGTPGGRSGRMDNGLHGLAAVAFHLLGEEEMAERWARPLCYMWMGREKGHAERIFSPAWGSIGASYAPEAEYAMFMQHMLWLYEISRRTDGGIMFGTRFPYPGGVTPAMALFMYLPEKRLRILGAPKKGRICDSVPTEPPADLVSVEAGVDGGRKRQRPAFLTRDARSRGSLQRVADAPPKKAPERRSP